jgi:flagellar biosynthesis protein FlhG
MRRQLMMQTSPGCPAGQAISQLASKLEKTVMPKLA